jgi:N-acetylmuramoyl-L-alanine amidase
MLTLGVRDRGYKRTDHYESRMVPAPVIIMEYLFLSNPREADLTRNPANLKLYGESTAIGIAKALNLPAKTQPCPEPSPPVDPNLYYRVIIGSYRQRVNADRALAEAKAKGFNDAFIVAFRRD